MTHFADRLADAIRAKGNAVCAGLDPRWELLPSEIRARHGADTLEAVAATLEEFCGRFLDIARKVGAGVFVLVRTSNPGGGQFQDLLVAAKGGAAPRPLYQHVGEAVASWSRENLGRCGFGDVGAVVGATYPVELTQLRQLLPEVLFLVPGFGAQGGTAADVLPAFRGDGLGAIVNSSRGL